MRAFTINPDLGNLSSADEQFRNVKGEALFKQADNAFEIWRRRQDVWTMNRRTAAAAAAAAATAATAATAPSQSQTPLSTPLSTPPTQRAAAEAAADDAQLLVPSEPEPLAERYDAMLAFLEVPDVWHTFDAGTTLMFEVEQAMNQNRMFAVTGTTAAAAAAAAASTSAGSEAEFKLLDTVCDPDPDEPRTDKFFGNLLVNYGFNNLLRSGDARDNPRDKSVWPHNFRQLGLEYVSHGGYNSVWRPNGTVDYGTFPFPREVVDALRNGTVVLRAVIPRDDREEWMSQRAALVEMTNMATAAQHGYGPHILAMGWERIKGIGKYTGELVPLYRLYAFLQRGTMDVDARMTGLAELTAQLTELPRLPLKSCRH